MSTALRLHVAIKVTQDDETTIVALRKDAEDARREAFEAKAQANEANGIIQSLRLEICSLKRKLKDVNFGSSNNNNNVRGNARTKGNGNDDDLDSLSINMTEEQAEIFSRTADSEVDDMMATFEQAMMLAPKRFGDKSRKNSNKDDTDVMPFQQWKMEKFIYTAEMPRVSESDALGIPQLKSRSEARRLKTPAGTLPSLLSFKHTGNPNEQRSVIV